jgi:hypothetical protein
MRPSERHRHSGRKTPNDIVIPDETTNDIGFPDENPGRHRLSGRIPNDIGFPDENPGQSRTTSASRTNFRRYDGAKLKRCTVSYSQKPLTSDRLDVQFVFIL